MWAGKLTRPTQEEHPWVCQRSGVRENPKEGQRVWRWKGSQHEKGWPSLGTEDVTSGGGSATCGGKKSRETWGRRTATGEDSPSEGNCLRCWAFGATLNSGGEGHKTVASRERCESKKGASGHKRGRGPPEGVSWGPVHEKRASGASCTQKPGDLTAADASNSYLAQKQDGQLGPTGGGGSAGEMSEVVFHDEFRIG